MVIKRFNLGNTVIEVDDTYYPKTEDEKEIIYKEFNKIGCEILKNKNLEGRWKPMKTLLLKITMLVIAFAIFFGMIWLAEFLASVISINTFMHILTNIAYIVGVLSFIYLIKE